MHWKSLDGIEGSWISNFRSEEVHVGVRTVVEKRVGRDVGGEVEGSHGQVTRVPGRKSPPCTGGTVELLVRRKVGQTECSTWG